MTIRIAYLLVLCLILPTVSFAAGEFDAFALKGVGARPGGMGGAFTALADDSEAVYYNPAGLGALKQNGVTAMYQVPSLSTSRNFVAGHVHWNSERFPGAVAIGWLRLRSTDIEITSSDERILGSDDLTNDLILIGAGVQVMEHLRLGASYKYFRFAFHGFNEGGGGLDLAAHADYGAWRAGLVFTDFGGTRVSGTSVATGEDVKDRIPWRLRPGLAYLWDHPYDLPIRINTLLDVAVNIQDQKDKRFWTGSEVWGFNDHAALRAGYEGSAGPTFGLGLRYGLLQLDYAYLLSLDLSDEHRVSTSIHF